MAKTKFDKVSKIFSLVAFLVTVYFAVKYIPSSDQFAREFGYLNMMESIFALVGLIFINSVEYGQLNLTETKSFNTQSAIRALIILFILVIVQLTTKVPLRVKTIEVAVSITAAAVCEELFFRGVLIGAVDNFDGFKYSISLFGKELHLIEIIGILVVAVLFMLIHQNYYGEFKLLLTVFLSGLVLNVAYWIWEDLTANILAHFLLNSMAVLPMLVNNLCMI